MEIDANIIRNLISLGYMAKENELEIEDVVEMIERGFVAIEPRKQTVLV